MCEKCDEIGQSIAHYRRLAFRIADQQMLDGIAQLIKQLEADKSIHRGSQKKQN